MASPDDVIMHHNGANAFKAATLLQLTVDSSLHHLFSERQFSKASPDGCQFYAKWKKRFSPAKLNLICPSHRLDSDLKALKKSMGSRSHICLPKVTKKNTGFPEIFFKKDDKTS